jgi:4-amino-4-deoxychorismate lyase
MKMTIIFNGKLEPMENAKICMSSKSVQLGLGLFETMRVKEGKIICLLMHWQRLSKAAKQLSLVLPLTFDELSKATYQLISHKKIIDGGLRLTVTAAKGDRGLLLMPNAPGNYLIESFNLVTVKESEPYHLCFSSIYAEPTNPLSKMKSSSYLTHVFVKREAQKRGFDDALQRTQDGFITETSSANFFMIKEGTLYTPPISNGLLPGVTRARILKHCFMIKQPCIVRNIHYKELSEADGCFISNALIGVRNVSKLERFNFPMSELLTALKLFVDG